MFREKNICKIILVIALILCNVVYPKIVKAEDPSSFEVFVDGMNGNDANTGSDETQPVKSWDKVKKLLGTKQGTIYVTGTVQASGYMSTYAPNTQTVKRASNFTGVMFEVPDSGEAYFFNIDVDGEDKQIDSPVIKLNESSRINFLENSVFHNIGFTNQQYRPNDLGGGIVCLLGRNSKIFVDGASFVDNNGAGVFFIPLPEFGIGGIASETVVKSVTFKNNKGFFYHNEDTHVTSNILTIHNALFRNNNASFTSQRYNEYGNERTGVIDLCNYAILRVYDTDSLAIFDNNEFDIVRLPDERDQQILFLSSDNSPVNDRQFMLGNGSPNYSWDNFDLNSEFIKIKSNPSPEDKNNALLLAKSIFEDNYGVIIDMNGSLNFGRRSTEQPPETPKVYDEPYVEPEPEPETPEVKTGSVLVEHRDADTDSLLKLVEYVVKDGKVGEDYETSKSSFPNYTFLKMDPNSAPVKGKVEEGTLKVVYLYKKDAVIGGAVTARYLDEDTKVLLTQDVVVKSNVPVGTSYQSEEKKFDNYVFSKMDVGSAPASGTVKETPQTVTYLYKKASVVVKKGSVCVTHVDDQGKVLKERFCPYNNADVGTAYKTEQMLFNNYKLKEIKGSATGTVSEGTTEVTYVYTSSVVNTGYDLNLAYVFAFMSSILDLSLVLYQKKKSYSK